MAMMKKNATVKAFTQWLSKHDRSEWLIACNTNADRGKTYDQWELLEMFDRYGMASGASKAVHVLDNIVIKRHKPHGYVPEIRNEYGTGNQLIDEVNCYKRYWDKPEADLLCPVLKWFTSKSDKVDPTSRKMQYNVLIVAQKAVKVGDAPRMCRKAEEMNRDNGLHGESAERRYEKLKAFSKSQNWRDALHNPGNSGVIFDYKANCYKAVFIDYAL
jgi:hypothetical protein